MEPRAAPWSIGAFPAALPSNSVEPTWKLFKKKKKKRNIEPINITVEPQVTVHDLFAQVGDLN